MYTRHPGSPRASTRGAPPAARRTSSRARQPPGTAREGATRTPARSVRLLHEPHVVPEVVDRDEARVRLGRPFVRGDPPRSRTNHVGMQVAQARRHQAVCPRASPTRAPAGGGQKAGWSVKSTSTLPTGQNSVASFGFRNQVAAGRGASSGARSGTRVPLAEAADVAVGVEEELVGVAGQTPACLDACLTQRYSCSDPPEAPRACAARTGRTASHAKTRARRSSAPRARARLPAPPKASCVVTWQEPSRARGAPVSFGKFLALRRRHYRGEPCHVPSPRCVPLLASPRLSVVSDRLEPPPSPSAFASSSAIHRETTSASHSGRRWWRDPPRRRPRRAAGDGWGVLRVVFRVQAQIAQHLHGDEVEGRGKREETCRSGCFPDMRVDRRPPRRSAFTPVRRGVAWVRRIHGHAVPHLRNQRPARVARSGATRSNVAPRCCCSSC